MSNSEKKLTRNFVKQLALVIAAVPLILVSNVDAQSFVPPSSRAVASRQAAAKSNLTLSNSTMEIERLLEIRSMMDGQATTLNSNLLNNRQRNVAVGQQIELEESAALSSLLSAPLPQSQRPLPSGPSRISSSSAVPQGRQSASATTGWIQPSQNQNSQSQTPGLMGSSQSRNRQSRNPQSGNPLRNTATLVGNPSTPQASGVQGYVQPASFQDDATSSVNDSKPSADPKQAIGQATRSSHWQSMQTAPRQLDAESRTAAQALPGSASSSSLRSFHRSLNEAISSPNLASELNAPTTEFSNAAKISSAELNQLKSTVKAASARSLLLSGSGSVEMPNAEAGIELIGPNDESTNRAGGHSNNDKVELSPPNRQEAIDTSVRTTNRQESTGQESTVQHESRQATEDPLADIENLIDNLKANVSSKSKVSDGIPAFQPYANSSTSTAMSMDQPAENLQVGSWEFDAAWIDIPAYDYARFRQYLHQAHLEQGPNPALQIAESQYHLFRSQFDRSAEALATLDRNKFAPSHQWMWAWQQAQLAIGTDQARLLRASIEEMGALPNTVDSLPFLTYCEAHLHRLQQPADHSASVKSLQQCLSEIEAAKENMDGPLQSQLTYLELKAHIDMGLEILVGPFKRSQSVSSRWFEATTTLLEESSLSGTNLEIAKISCLLDKMQAKARGGNTGDLAVDFAFLKTQLTRLKAELATEDARWLDQRYAEVNYDCAISSFHQEDFKSAQMYLEGVTNWLQTEDAADKVWNQYCLARCYWLEGALADMQNKPLSGLQAYERFVEAIPNHLTTRINADQGNQSERLGTVAVAMWKQGQKERAIQIAQASVAQMYGAIEQGFAIQPRVERLEQNLALMQHQLANPKAGPEQRQATGSRQRTPAQMASSRQSPAQRNVQGQAAQNRVNNSQVINQATAAQRNSGPGNNGPGNNSQRPSGQSPTNDNPSNTPVKSFFKNLFSNDRGPTGRENSETPAQRHPAYNGQSPVQRPSVRKPAANLPAASSTQSVAPNRRVPVVNGN